MVIMAGKRLFILCLLVSIACLGTAQAKPKKIKHNNGSNSAWRLADKKLDRRIDALEAAQAVPGPVGPPGPEGPPGPPGDGGDVAELEARVAALEQLVIQQHAALQAMLGCIDPSSNSFDLVFDGCNVHIRNGNNLSDSANSFGNLIIGYNEDSGGASRVGSHNLVIGPEHSFSGNNGIVAGLSGGNQALLNLNPSAGTLDLSAAQVRINAEQDVGIEAGFGDLSLASSSGGVDIVAGQHVELQTGSSKLRLEPANLTAESVVVDIDGRSMVTVDAAVTTVKGNSQVSIDGALVQINGPGKPAARTTDAVNVAVPTGTGLITGGSSTVLIGD